MNRIKRIAATAAISAAVLSPAAAAIAYADAPTQAEMDQTIHREQQYMLYRQQQYMQEFGPSDEQRPESATVDVASDAATATAGFPWETVGIMTLGAAAVATGSVIVGRRIHRTPKHA
jgi:hypothetical protein